MFQKYQGFFGFFREFFDIGLVLETFRVAFKKGEGNRRLRVCLLLIVVCVVFGPLQGKCVDLQPTLQSKNYYCVFLWNLNVSIYNSAIS